MDTTVLQNLLNYAINAAKLVDQVAHGFALSELTEGASLLTGGSSVFASAPQALAEYKALADADRAAVDADIVANVAGFTDANVGTAVQAVLEFAVGLSQIVQLFPNA